MVLKVLKVETETIKDNNLVVDILTLLNTMSIASQDN